MNLFIKKQKNDDEGQALIELLAFIPLFLLLFSTIMIVSSAINGSINQQKIVRSFLFFDLYNNPMGPSVHRLKTMAERNLEGVGSYAIGWKEKSDGGVPIAPCYGISELLTGKKGETCEDATAVMSEEKTNFIRLYTVFGVCTAYYRKSGSGYVYDPMNWANCSLGF